MKSEQVTFKRCGQTRSSMKSISVSNGKTLYRAFLVSD